MDNINDNRGLDRKYRFSGIVKVLGSFLEKHSYFCSARSKQNRKSNYADEKSNNRTSPELEESKDSQPVTDD